MDLYRMSLWSLFSAGGPLMWPIILCSVFAAAIVMEKFWYLHKITLDSQSFLDNYVT